MQYTCSGPGIRSRSKAPCRVRCPWDEAWLLESGLRSLISGRACVAHTRPKTQALQAIAWRQLSSLDSLMLQQITYEALTASARPYGDCGLFADLLSALGPRSKACWKLSAALEVRRQPFTDSGPGRPRMAKDRQRPTAEIRLQVLRCDYLVRLPHSGNDVAHPTNDANSHLLCQPKILNACLAQDQSHSLFLQAGEFLEDRRALTSQPDAIRAGADADASTLATVAVRRRGAGSG